jgi:hypothetical protein
MGSPSKFDPPWDQPLDFSMYKPLDVHPQCSWCSTCASTGNKYYQTRDGRKWDCNTSDPYVPKPPTAAECAARKQQLIDDGILIAIPKPAKACGTEFSGSYRNYAAGNYSQKTSRNAIRRDSYSQAYGYIPGWTPPGGREQHLNEQIGGLQNQGHDDAKFPFIERWAQIGARKLEEYVSDRPMREIIMDEYDLDSKQFTQSFCGPLPASTFQKKYADGTIRPLTEAQFKSASGELAAAKQGRTTTITVDQYSAVIDMDKGYGINTKFGKFSIHPFHGGVVNRQTSESGTEVWTSRLTSQQNQSFPPPTFGAGARHRRARVTREQMAGSGSGSGGAGPGPSTGNPPPSISTGPAPPGGGGGLMNATSAGSSANGGGSSNSNSRTWHRQKAPPTYRESRRIYWSPELRWTGSVWNSTWDFEATVRFHDVTERKFEEKSFCLELTKRW